MRFAPLLLAALLCLPLAACSDDDDDDATPAGDEFANVEESLELASSAFADGQAIPVEFTCDGANQSPPLSWQAGPEGTKSFALIVRDPDAPGGNFDHWVVFNLPAENVELQQGFGAAPGEGGVALGKNSTGKIGYTGPCPPKGQAHHYRFLILALDARLDPSISTAGDLILAAQGHVLARGDLTGTYRRAE
ncbi:MAG: YbhB/YbcL family Raf kinase inhibitor-like protein [Hyphomicrobiales bacterium]